MNRWLFSGLALLLIAGGAYLIWTAMQPGKVTVTWETGSERDTAGFNVWRTDPKVPFDVPVRQVNTDLIPARGSALAGASYELVDTSVQPGVDYIYQIEEVDVSGNARRQPDTIAVRAGWPRAWVLAEAILVMALGVVLLVAQWRWSRVPPPAADPDLAPPSAVDPDLTPLETTDPGPTPPIV